MSNIIRIKRRLPDSLLGPGAPSALSGGELAFNEIDSVLYYGASAGVIPIAGKGAFVDLTSSQVISGSKTFTNSTTLSSIVFLPNSFIDINSNVIRNVGTAVLSGDAVNKKALDDVSLQLSNFVDLTTNQTISGIKTFKDIAYFNSGIGVTGNVDSSTYSVNGVNIIDSNRTASFTNLSASGDVLIKGNLTVLGENTIIETIVTTTSSFSITNNGTGPALTVTQTGNAPIAAFYDDLNYPALYVDGTSLYSGNVGIGTSTPNQKLTVYGNISAYGDIFASKGDFSSTLHVADVVTFDSKLNVYDLITSYNSISGLDNISNLYDFTIDCGSF